MIKPDFLSAQEAVKLIKDGDTICNVGMTLVGTPESLYKEIERSFLEENRPKGLTVFHPSGFSDRIGGIERIAHEGLISRLVGSHWGLAPKTMNLISNNKVEAYNMPFGVLANMFDDMCTKLPGTISLIGLGTYLDPRIEGGRMNDISKDETVKLIQVDGTECLLYKHTPIDVLLIRGSYADEDGNISTIDEACRLETLPAVLATKRYGGKVIVQVKSVLKKGSIHPKEVEIPGVHVDAVVVCENPYEDHRQTSSWFQDDSYSGRLKTPITALEPMPLNERKVIVRRAVMNMYPDILINVGTGVPTDAMGPILAEEGLMEDVTISVESGAYGGIPAGGVDFGVSQNPIALIPQNLQFHVYDGRGVDFTFMGSGEMDAEGNVNATKMGNITPGCGGFVNITTMAKNVMFCSTFTAKGLKVEFSEEEGVKIIQEGKIKKLKKKVRQISYNAKLNVASGQNTYFVTERAVFHLTVDGPVLIEIAKGIDLQKDILDQMDFIPKIADDLKQIDTRIYRKGASNLREYMLEHNV